jgi:hypothetical protein
VRGFDAHALAVDSAQRFFESSDFGQNWQEVDGPPGKGGPEACSDVGCRASNWLRIGWGPAPPIAQPAARIVPAPPFYEAPQRPVLDCRERGAPALATRSLTQPANDSGGNDYGFGARQLLLRSGSRSFFRELFGAAGSNSNGLLAMIYARVPEIAHNADNGAVPAAPAELGQKAIYSVRAFDPQARVGVAHVTWKGQAEAALRVGGALPELEISDQEEGVALPVAAGPPLFGDGLLLKENGPALWLRDQKDTSPAPISLGNGRDDFEISDAASPRRGELVLLAVDSDEQAHVIGIGPKGTEELFAYPARPSALAVDVHGEAALFFGPTGVEPPSADDPALIVRARSAAEKLAVWSTLKPASAPECSPSDDDYRVLIRAKRSWLGLLEASNPQSAQSDVPEMLALVRVNHARFCLEALELTATAVDGAEVSVPTRVVVRFDKEPSAGRVGVTLGGEYRQALRCELR